tara:strand:- start:1452 stop:2021 length:570 start_codon:yes stop_codon:yes gene_type:complete
MLILNKCRVMSTPKTGSKWVEQACLNSIEGAFALGDAKYHSTLQELEVDLPAIAFVRHPLQWFPSYWNHRMWNGWDDDSRIDASCKSNDFGTFMTAVLERFPGWLTKEMVKYVGTVEAPAEFIGRHESLQADLITGLKFLNEDFDEEKLLGTPVTNTGNYEAFPAVWTDALKESVCDSEQELIQRFYNR